MQRTFCLLVFFTCIIIAMEKRDPDERHPLENSWNYRILLPAIDQINSGKEVKIIPCDQVPVEKKSDSKTTKNG